ncbi:MAG: hypothetical protein PVI54_17100 [Desulfobacteraceae bacterium]|jgi:hypothetical protein
MPCIFTGGTNDMATFYRDEPQELKMFRLLKKLVYKEMAGNTYPNATGPRSNLARR